MNKVPDGWKIKKVDNPPFNYMEIIAPNGWSTIVGSHERNPMNILYLLAEALITIPQQPSKPT